MPRWYTSTSGNHITPTIQENDNLFRDTIKTRLGTMMAVLASEKDSPVQMTYERTAIKACLLELESYGYLIPDLSWFKIKALRRNQHDIVSLCESLLRENLHDIVSEFC